MARHRSNLLLSPRLFELESRLLPSVSLLGDFNKDTFGSNVADVTVMGGQVFYTAEDGSGNRALWKTDGTPGNATKLRDICPGSGQEIGNIRIAANLTNVNGTLFFSAFSFDTKGTELWKTDGTSDGTKMVKNIKADGTLPQFLDDGPKFLTNVSGTLYFTANDGLSGRELWKSDGSEIGTVMVRDICPGLNAGSSGVPLPSTLYGPRNLVNVGGTLYFSANDGSSGYELWKSGGTAATTSRVMDINSGAGSSNPENLTNLNGVLYFGAEDGKSTAGIQLWRTTGAGGAELVTGIPYSAPRRFLPQGLTVAGDGVYFHANGRLLKVNATGASLVGEFLNPLLEGGAKNFANVNGTLYFGVGGGLWKTTGSPETAVLVQDNLNPYGLTNINGTLYFRANDGASGLELWKLDGTTPSRVADINPGPAGSVPFGFVPVGSSVAFVADDGSHGSELWFTGGAAPGTAMVKDINTNTRDFTRGFQNEVAVNGFIYFFAHDHGDADAALELWRTDGTTTSRVKAFGTPSSHPRGEYAGNLTNVNGILYFTANDGTHGMELWRSNGNEDGTSLVLDIFQGPSGSNPSNLTNVSGTLFFAANDGFNGCEL